MTESRSNFHKYDYFGLVDLDCKQFSTLHDKTNSRGHEVIPQEIFLQVLMSTAEVNFSVCITNLRNCLPADNLRHSRIYQPSELQ
jgi:hypothetical protein